MDGMNNSEILIYQAPDGKIIRLMNLALGLLINFASSRLRVHQQEAQS
jgi:hypothetical protein